MRVSGKEQFKVEAARNHTEALPTQSPSSKKALQTSQTSHPGSLPNIKLVVVASLKAWSGHLLPAILGRSLGYRGLSTVVWFRVWGLRY